MNIRSTYIVAAALSAHVSRNPAERKGHGHLRCVAELMNDIYVQPTAPPRKK